MLTVCPAGVAIPPADSPMLDAPGTRPTSQGAPALELFMSTVAATPLLRAADAPPLTVKLDSVWLLWVLLMHRPGVPPAM